VSRVREIQLPDFGRDEILPPISADEYQERLDAAVKRMKEAGLDYLLVYADREHFANMAFLTGFDPRFEEALLLLDTQGGRRLLVGNECMGYLPDRLLACDPILFQEFSLLGQPRARSATLRSILVDFGIRQNTRVGCAGWKYFDDATHALDIPSFLADTVREIAGNANVTNVTAIFMNAEYGLRATNSASQIAQFEFASCRTSDSVRNAIRRLKPGVAEWELESALQGDGIPRSCHPMVSFGTKAQRGLSSPSGNRAQSGDFYTIAFGVWGALTCRAGALCANPDDLPTALRKFYVDLSANYYDVVAAWYESCRIGATGGQVFAAVDACRNSKLFDFAVNPGHLIHLDEWVHSPFSPGNRAQLRSGMALQMDIIPVSKGPQCCVNAEDGIVLADRELREELSQRFPTLWKRVLARRQFMLETLKIRLDESVLPLSNIPAWLPPYALSLDCAFVNR
jgi:Xaa-Pro aminopeptidase